MQRPRIYGVADREVMGVKGLHGNWGGVSSIGDYELGSDSPEGPEADEKTLNEKHILLFFACNTAMYQTLSKA